MRAPRSPAANYSSQQSPGPEAGRGHADPRPPADVRGGHSPRRRAALQPMAEGRGRAPFYAVAGPAAEGERGGSGLRRCAGSGARLRRAGRQVKAGRGGRAFSGRLPAAVGAGRPGPGGGLGLRARGAEPRPGGRRRSLGGPRAAATLSPGGERHGPARGSGASRGARVPRSLRAERGASGPASRVPPGAAAARGRAVGRPALCGVTQRCGAAPAGIPHRAGGARVRPSVPLRLPESELRPLRKSCTESQGSSSCERPSSLFVGVYKIGQAAKWQFWLRFRGCAFIAWR